MTANNKPTAPGTGARRQMLVMGLCYGLGAFNDNFYKQAALLLAATAGLAGFQGWGTFLFALPFVLFSAWAGWLADRCSKKTVIIWSKLLEVVAMLIGAWGMVTLQWPWLLTMIFCLGLNSTLFSPALNGSIPEFFPPSQVPRVNALFKLATTAAILAGIALSGFALDGFGLFPLITEGIAIKAGKVATLSAAAFGQWMVAGIAFMVSVAGILCTVFLVGHPGAGSVAPFPRSGPLNSFRDLLALRKSDPALLLTMSGEAFFYFLSSLVVLLITNLGRQELGLSYTATSLLSVGLLMGICAGSLLAARGTPWSWLQWMVPSLTAICLLLCSVPLVSKLPENLHLPVLFAVYGLTGLGGGVYLIPLTSFAQVRPAPTERGRILGVSNCLTFTAILLTGPVFTLLALLAPSTAHVVTGAGTGLVALLFLKYIRRLPAYRSIGW